MGKMVDWEQKFEAELVRGEKARRDGNEGMARVCARRAAGLAARAFVAEKEIQLPKTSHTALQYLKYLSKAEVVDENTREIAKNFVINITTDHIIPGDVDLITEARVFKNLLFNG